ncbi:MAG: type IV pilus biogenesis protein PilM [Desulfitobacteriaceae bacterium]
MGKVVVLEITEREIRALWFNRRRVLGRKPLLTAVEFDRIPIPAGVIRQGQLLDSTRLSDLLKEYRLKRFPLGEVEVLFSPPWPQGFVRAYRLPWFPPGKRKQALRYFVEEEVPIPGDELLYDFLILSEQAESFLDVLVGAIRKSVLEDYVQSLESAGFRVEGADFAVSSLSRALLLKPGEDVLYLQLEHLSLQMALFRGPRPEIIRNLQGAPGQSWIEECSRELERILLYYTTQHPDFSLRRILLTGDPAGREIAENLTQNLGPAIQIEEASPDAAWVGQESRILKEYRTAPISFALGFKLLKAKPGLNLWRRREQTRKVWKLTYLVAALTLMILIVSSVLWLPLQAKEKHLTEELIRLKPEGTKAEVVLRLEEGMKVDWAKVRQHPVKVGESLAQVDNFLVPGVILKEIEYKQGGLFVRGAAEKAGQVEMLIQALRRIGWENPALSSYEQKEGERIEFALAARKITEAAAKLE